MIPFIGLDIVGAGGASVSMVMAIDPDEEDLFPAASVALAVKV